MNVTQKEICDILRRPAQNSHDTYHHRIDLADRIEREGIAPPDGYEIVPIVDACPKCKIKHTLWRGVWPCTDRLCPSKPAMLTAAKESL